MKIKNCRTKLGVLFFLMLMCAITVTAQTSVKGFIRDAVTQEPLAFVSVYFQGGNGVTSNDDGSYSISSNNGRYTALVFSYTGYKKITKKIVPGTEQTINIDLETTNSLSTVVIKAKRGKYRNKNNPAVELIDKVIANKEKNRITAYDYVQYQQYEKLGLSLTNKPEKIMNNRLFKNYKFILENVDTTTLEGKALVPVYLEEKLAQNYYRKNPLKNKSYILASKKVNYGDLIDDKGITSYLKRLYADINIYDNNIVVLTSQFLSPIADMAPTFYRFFITDTVENDGIKLIKLNFMPRNTTDLLFRGVMYVTLDGNYGVQKINLSVSKKANLNWARELKIDQSFEKNPADGRYHVIKSSMKAEFALRQNSASGILGERTVSFKNFEINKPAADTTYTGSDEVIVNTPGSESDSFWISSRHQQLSNVEAKVYSNIDSLKNMKSFKNTLKIATLLFSGWIKFGPIQIGNTNTFYSFNSLEGFRAKVGGRTTTDFSKRFYLEGYGGYGFKDKKYKYLLAGAYSFNAKSIYTYPLNYVKFTRQYETALPGQELVFAPEDNFLLSFKRGTTDKWFYQSSYKLEYVHEFGKNFTYKIRYQNLKQTPAGSLVFEKPANMGLDTIQNITTSEFTAELRWAPNEQFYQGINFRTPIRNKFPIFTLRLQDGIKGFLKGQYNYQQLTLAIAKRCYLSQLGYLDVTLEGGHIFGQVPFPLLDIHRANQSYAYQLNAYNLMNFMEFVSDNYAAVNTDLYLNGFIFNKIPLLKKLKLREVGSFKILYGGLRDENNPAKNQDVYNFPKAGPLGVPTTYSLSRAPYMEASVGIANIFKFLRVDLVKRLAYLDHPDISTWGIRTRVKFDF
ncbi:DUF5686 family protein [Ferruginibacter paludis]|uniref:DUF5686 and carboxypeptidase-like regulatory domain-containing protein n=1 Tax=Ferruginibacter paludis TaxID=1310417 RepID=UPI0025B48378|nr:DUF5686 and carboxypeptidase-like regulatory domain-containing protein [Ferruginibacter paludis]MDN3659097.1 DUF5686 family protein [Ferruginibacter paludis]